MLHLKFPKSAGLNLQSAVAYVNQLDTVYGIPREGMTTYCVPIANLAAQADPNDPAAAWAVDISFGQTPYPGDPNDPSLFKTPTELNASAVLPFPVGTEPFNLESYDPAWFAFVIPP